MAHQNWNPVELYRATHTLIVIDSIYTTFKVIKWNSIPWNTSDNIFLFLFSTANTWIKLDTKALKTSNCWRLHIISLHFLFFLISILVLSVSNAKWKMMNGVWENFIIQVICSKSLLYVIVFVIQIHIIVHGNGIYEEREIENKLV